MTDEEALCVAGAVLAQKTNSYVQAAAHLAAMVFELKARLDRANERELALRASLRRMDPAAASATADGPIEDASPEPRDEQAGLRDPA